RRGPDRGRPERSRLGSPLGVRDRPGRVLVARDELARDGPVDGVEDALTIAPGVLRDVDPEPGPSPSVQNGWTPSTSSSWLSNATSPPGASLSDRAFLVPRSTGGRARC